MNTTPPKAPNNSTELDAAIGRRGLSSLDTPERIGEILFGLIMVLTFTGSLSVSEAARADVREMLVGALGCNLAWGIIDALFYLMNCITERGHNHHLLRMIQRCSDSEQRKNIILSALPEWLPRALKPDHLEHIEQLLLNHDPAKEKDGWALLSNVRDAFYIFALVFLSTFPVTIPFIIMADPGLALRISNLVAVFLLFTSGYALGHYSGQRPLIWGLSTALVGAAVVSLTIAFGG